MTSGVTATESSVTGLYVGASGFSYASWKGGFYPAAAKPADFLRHYAERLSTVELNNTFYRLPAEAQFERWAQATPRGFRFAVKMPMAITHWGRLDEIGTFSERVRTLGERLGPILVRPHDTRPRDDGFLRLVLDSLDPGFDVALDLRDPSWDGVEPLLAGWPAVRVNQLEAPAGFRYLRFREPPYDDHALEASAERIRGFLAAGLRVYCYFRHEDEPTAPRYAERLRELVGAQRA
jgi:uncharacterized protein YecE (DUF72 family)